MLFFYKLSAHKKYLERHFKDRLTINDKQRNLILKKGEYVDIRKYERKIKSPFIIHTDFGNMLVPEYNEKEKLDKSYTKNILMKNILLTVMATGYYVLMISLLNLLSHN